MQCEVDSVVLLIENASKLKIDIHSPLEELTQVVESSNEQNPNEPNTPLRFMSVQE